MYHNNGIRQRYPRHITPAFHFPENEGSSDYLPAGTGMSLPACRTDLLPRITAGRRLRQRPDLLDTFQGSRLPGLLHGSSTGLPLWSTTTTLGCTFNTSSISRSWHFGSFMDVLSYPSDSNISGSPAKITATSASAAEMKLPALVPSSSHFR